MYNEYTRTVNKFKKQGVEEAMWSNTICVRNLQTLAHFVGAVHAGQCSEKIWEVSQQQLVSYLWKEGRCGSGDYLGGTKDIFTFIGKKVFLRIIC